MGGPLAVTVGVPVSVGVGDVLAWGWTRMVTVIPCGAVVLALGFCCHTSPGAVLAGPATVCTVTLKPALCSDACALCSLRPTTFGTLAAPETNRVILDPGSTKVPPTGSPTDTGSPTATTATPTPSGPGNGNGNGNGGGGGGIGF